MAQSIEEVYSKTWTIFEHLAIAQNQDDHEAGQHGGDWVRVQARGCCPTQKLLQLLLSAFPSVAVFISASLSLTHCSTSTSFSLPHLIFIHLNGSRSCSVPHKNIFLSSFICEYSLQWAVSFNQGFWFLTINTGPLLRFILDTLLLPRIRVIL